MVGPRTQGLVPVGPCPDLSQAIPQLVPQAALDKARVPTALTQAECWNESPGEVYHSQTSPFLSRTRKISQPPPPSFLVHPPMIGQVLLTVPLSCFAPLWPV